MNLDLAFSALSDPTRRAILAELALGERTVMELVAPFSMSQPAVSKHLRLLEQAGFIARRVDGTTRPCRLLPQGLTELQMWLERMRSIFEQNYQRLDSVLADLVSDGSFVTKTAKTKRRR